MKASNRRRIGHALVAGFAFLAITLGNSAAVRADIVATFSTTGTGDYTYTGGTTTSTLATSPTPLGGSVTFGSTFFTPQGPYAATISLLATSTTAASGITQDGFNGSYTIINNSGGTVGGVAQGGTLLTVSFTGAILSVSGGSATLQSGPSPGTTTITPATGFGAPITAPESFALSLSGVSYTGVTSSFGFNNFLANDTSTASATIVPEPSTMAIAGLGALGMIGYGLRRRKALGA